MNGQFWVNLGVSALTDFVITAGTSLAAAMVATGSPSVPTPGVIVLACVMGAVAAAKEVSQKLMNKGA